MTERVVVLDFGGQSNQLLVRRVRDSGVFSELLPCTASIAQIKGDSLSGVILSGGPNDVNATGALTCDPAVFELGVPVLGVCYGMQTIAKEFGGIVDRAETGEYGRTDMRFEPCALFEGVAPGVVWMSHKNSVMKAPGGFVVTADSPHCPIAAMQDESRRIYAVQFHPEVTHTESGMRIIRNFLQTICGCKCTWKAEALADALIRAIREQVGDGHVVAGLSGGVDSTVAAALVQRAIGDRLTCIFVDHGLLRKNEAETVIRNYTESMKLNLVTVDASERFLSKLRGVTDPEEKRKIIGTEFIRVFEEEAKKTGAEFLLQGTIYPDVIESGTAQSAKIKSHHNVGGLPKNMQFKGLVEPLRTLFKDEVRALGESLGLPETLVWRQPFPGPGLAIRIIGDITADKLAILRESDAVLRDEISKAGLNRSVWQYFTVFTGLRSVGVQGDERTYDYTIAVRAVTSTDVMSVEWAHLPYDVLERISTRIIAEVPHVNRVVYDITSKPPGTVEWASGYVRRRSSFRR